MVYLTPKAWFLLDAAAQTGDFITTTYFTRRWGLDMEANPIVRTVVDKTGYGGFAALKALVVFLSYRTLRQSREMDVEKLTDDEGENIGVSVSQRGIPGGAVFMTLLTAVVVLNNVAQIAYKDWQDGEETRMREVAGG